MNRKDLVGFIKSQRSFLCVGLDADINKLPKHLLRLDDPIFAFNKQIIDATKDFCVAYKPNIAFYESLGSKGWISLERTLNYIPKTHFTIADAKRGDIGNTSTLYAKAFFETMDFDSITVAPYMGEDSVSPFLGFDDKWVIILGLTSNKGSSDFQLIKDKHGKMLHEHVLSKASQWGDSNNTMFVIGATHPEEFTRIRSIIPNHFLLVPGIGAQGGDLKKVCEYGLIDDVGLLVNSSRGIIYAGDGVDFARNAGIAAKQLQQQMELILLKRDII